VRRMALCAVAAVTVATASTAAVVQAKTTLRLKAAANGALKFNKTTLHAKKGKVTIRFTNPSSSGKPHAVELEGKGIEKRTRTLQPGRTATLTVTLKKGGRYEFYCPVTGHKAAGMKGKLIVS
jgi:uncharacterized cupredoxin-like copper-binding protein